MYAAACAARVAEAEASPVMVRQRDGRLEPRPVPTFTSWERLDGELRAGWELKASLEPDGSGTEEAR